MSRNPRQSLAVGRLCNVCKDKPQPPEARVPHADDKRGGKRLCSHRRDKNKRGAGILRVPSLFTPPTLSQQENPDYFPLLSRPPQPPAPLPAASTAESRRKERALPFPLEMAQPRLLLRFALPKHQFSRNQETLCNSGGGGDGGGELEPARSTCRREGAAIKAATLRWRVPSPDKAAKVYVTNAPRTLAAAGQPRAQPGPRPAPSARAPRERAGSPEPGRVGSGRSAYRVLALGPASRAAGRRNGGRERARRRLGSGWGRAPGRRRGRGSGGGWRAGPRAPWPRREMCVSRSVPSAALRRRPPAPP